MHLNVGKELAAMEQMAVGQLRDRYAEVFGETTNARNKQWLLKKIIWRLQSQAEAIYQSGLALEPSRSPATPILERRPPKKQQADRHVVLASFNRRCRNWLRSNRLRPSDANGESLLSGPCPVRPHKCCRPTCQDDLPVCLALRPLQIPAVDHRRRWAVLRSLLRAAVWSRVLSRLSGQNLIQGDGTRARVKRNFQMLSPLDFLAEFTQHIPPKGSHLIRYYGWYSNKSRGVRKKTEAEASATSSSEAVTSAAAATRCSQAWAMLIKRVYEVDPMCCPECGGQMKVVLFIEPPQAETYVDIDTFLESF